MPMTKRQKLYFLLNRIDDAKAITPKGKPVLIDPVNDLNKKIRGVELDQLFTKLEKDHKVLRVTKPSDRIATALYTSYGFGKPDDGNYHITLLPSFEKYFSEIQHHPEYEEFVGKKPQEVSFKEETDSWLSVKERWALERIWQVVNALNAEWQLWDKDEFAIPLDKFYRSKVNENDLAPILSNLHNKGYIEVSKKTGETPPSNYTNKPEASLWVTIDDNLGIVRDSGTRIRVFSEKFGYLVTTLGLLVKDGNSESKKGVPLRLKDVVVKYDKKKSKIIFGNKDCELPPGRFEDEIANFMFNKKVGERVSWDLIYEKLQGHSPSEIVKNKKSVYDAISRLNKKVKDTIKTKDVLFTMKDTEVVRNF